METLSEMDWDLIWSEVEWDGIELNEIEENVDGRDLNGMKWDKIDEGIQLNGIKWTGMNGLPEYCCWFFYLNLVSDWLDRLG